MAPGETSLSEEERRERFVILTNQIEVFMSLWFIYLVIPTSLLNSDEVAYVWQKKSFEARINTFV